MIHFLMICNLDYFVKLSLYRKRGSTFKTRLIKNGKEFLNPKDHLFDIETKTLYLPKVTERVKNLSYIAFYFLCIIVTKCVFYIYLLKQYHYLCTVCTIQHFTFKTKLFLTLQITTVSPFRNCVWLPNTVYTRVF